MSHDAEDSLVTRLMRLWYVWLLLLGVGFAIGIGRSAGPTPNEPAPANTETQEDLRAKLNQGLARQETQVTSGPKAPEVVIAEHQEELAALESAPNPDPERTPALLSALGNLHRQKNQDYATAARYYEQLIQEFPEWPGVNAIYHQLIACYTQLEDQPSLRRLYRQMMDVFPQDSKEYEYANAALSGQL